MTHAKKKLMEVAPPLDAVNKAVHTTAASWELMASLDGRKTAGLDQPSQDTASVYNTGR